MSDPVTRSRAARSRIRTDATVDRLNAALEGRYAIERELGEGAGLPN